MDGISIRSAEAADGPFLVEMLAEAAERPGEPVLGDPELARYVAGWPRPGDLGVIAVGDTRPVGAAWLRFFTAGDAGYGFVRPEVPELAIAVVDGLRGRGVGRALLRELERAATGRGIVAISLSVRRTNPAGALYRAAGYRFVEHCAGSDTMLKELAVPST